VDGTIVAEQLEVVALTVVKLQGVPVKVPVAVPLFVNATVPAGVLAVPAADVSLTKAVQVTDCDTTTTPGEHVIVVEVVLRATVTVLLVPVLARWTPSVGVYEVPAMTVPWPVGLKVTEQLDVVLLTVVRLQGDPVNEPLAEPVLLNATVPPGEDALPVLVSFTKAVQLMDWATTTEVGEHVTVDEVVLVPPTVTVLLVPVLPA